MPDQSARRVVQRARTAAGLPGRVVDVEDRCSALEAHVMAQIDEMRSDLTEIRELLQAVLSTEADLAGLIGRMLSDVRGRLDSIESGAPDADTLG